MDLSKANLDYLENDDPVKDAALTNIRTASELGVNPDAVAKSRQLASSLKLPEAVVHENMDVARAKAWTQAADSWLVDAPATTEFMADPQNAKVALDDVEALRNIEDLRKKADAAPWFSQEKQDAVREYSRAMKDNWGISKAYNAMGYQLEKVAPLAKRQLHNVLSTGAEDPDLDVELFRAKALAPESPKAENFFETAAYSAAELLPIIINFMGAYAAGGAAGGAGAALTVAPGFFTPATAPAAIGTTLSGAGMGAKIAGAKASFDLESAFFYADMNDVRDENGEPLDPMVKAGGAVIYGAGASVLELTGFSALAKILPGGSRLTKEILAPLLKEGLKDKAVQAALRDVAVRYAGGVSVETLTELGQEALSIITEIAGKQVSEAKDDTYFAPTDWAAQAERMKEVGIKTFLGTGLLGVGPAGVSAVVEGRQAQQVQTWRDQQTELHAAIQSSATMQRDPETMKAFGQILGLGEEAWIDAEALQQWGPEFLQRIGVDAGAVAQAAQDGSMIRLDTGRLMYEAEYPDLLQDLRPAPSAMSAREAAAYDPVQALKDIEDLTLGEASLVDPMEQDGEWASAQIEIDGATATAGEVVTNLRSRMSEYQKFVECMG